MPPVLTVCLNRIALDYATWTRKKINSRFEYPLELDMSKYLDVDGENAATSQATDENQFIYELKSIVIHSGGPYGGHYKGFIRDDLGEGNWDLELPQTFAEKPVDKNAKEEEKKEEEKKDGEEEKKEEEELIDEKKIDWKSMTKGERKKMNKKIQE